MGYLQKLITDAYSGPGSYDAAKSARFRALLGARRQVNAVPLDDEALKTAGIPSDLVLKYLSGEVGGWYNSQNKTAYYPPGNRALRRHEVMHGIHDAARNRPAEFANAVPSWALSGDGSTARGELLARLAGGRENILDWDTGYYAQIFPENAAGFRAIGVPVGTARTMIGRLGSDPVPQGIAGGLLAPVVAGAGIAAGYAAGSSMAGEPEGDPLPTLTPTVPGVRVLEQLVSPLPAKPRPQMIKTDDGWMLLEEQ